MLEFQRKKKIRSMIYSRLALIIILVILAVFIKSTAEFYSKTAESKKRRVQFETEYNNLQQRKANLDAKIDRLNSPVGVEEELRDRYDLTKENEQTILISNQGSSSTLDANQ